MISHHGIGHSTIKVFHISISRKCTLSCKISKIKLDIFNVSLESNTLYRTLLIASSNGEIPRNYSAC